MNIIKSLERLKHKKGRQIGECGIRGDPVRGNGGMFVLNLSTRCAEWSSFTLLPL